MNTEESRDRRQHQQGKMQAILDYTVGVATILLGLFIFFIKKFPVEFEFKEPAIANTFAGLSILYGAWRIYRGIKKSRAN
ncbi:MAG: hypothetical protein HY252_01450 [Sphingobacteriales bacterium]|nr:hypothetical protein [Sphingobacteriales bacterium]